MSVTYAVDLQNVDVSVPQRRIVRSIDWRLPVGSRAAVLGPNGSGKSTLLKAITAYGHITSGRAVVLNETLGKTDVHFLRRRMGIVDPSLVRLLDRGVTARQLVATGFFGHLTTFFDRPSDEQLQLADRVLSEVGLADAICQRVDTLSSGQRSRVWLARALVHRPELLVMDEPAADLDLPSRETLLATLDGLANRWNDLTMITVTHHLEDLLPGTTDVLLLSHGEVVASGSPEAVLTSENLSRAFECPINVACDDGRWRWSVSRHAWDRLLRELA